MDSKIIIYGAGEMGHSYGEFLQFKGLGDVIYGYCDRNAADIKTVNGVPCFTYDEVKEQKYPFVIAMRNSKAVEHILKTDAQVYYMGIGEWAAAMGQDMMQWNRDFCAFYHTDHMESYYQEAEQKDSLDVFWQKDSTFRKMFDQLDLANVIELACGRGRHVPRYIDEAHQVTLVDILAKNISFCRERFQAKTNISYYCNDGFDLHELADNCYTALFTYDAMVHFELLDIFSYLKDIQRVLLPGGKALFHHSNNSVDYRLDFSNGPAGRNYMSQGLFAYLAYRAGFEVIQQQLIDWGGIKDSDCISLVQKTL